MKLELLQLQRSCLCQKGDAEYLFVDLFEQASSVHEYAKRAIKLPRYVQREMNVGPLAIYNAPLSVGFGCMNGCEGEDDAAHS